MTPDFEASIPKIMQSIGRRYVQYINNTYQRTGTLWEGRYKASLVDAEHYLLTCYRYIELNPVRASMVEHPSEYLWSSYNVNAGIKPRRKLVMHDVYQRLGPDNNARSAAYRGLFSQHISQQLIREIQQASTFSLPLGDSAFKQQIEQATKQKLGHAKRGRPLKSNE
tara:strand:+ start:14986 stop:15486 length:501 start_codon:yes stop_codon:yes gene_type:complete